MKLAALGTLVGTVCVIVSVLKCVADVGSAEYHSTRFKSNSTEVEFGCMFRMHTMAFGKQRRWLRWGGSMGWMLGWGLLVLLGATRTCVCGTVSLMVAARECLHRQPCVVLALVRARCGMLV